MVTILADRVLVRRIETEEKTAGGIVVTGSAIEPRYEGLVLKIGDGRTTKTGTLIPMSINVNDTVLYYPNAGLSVKIDGEELLVLREDEIYAVVEK